MEYQQFEGEIVSVETHRWGYIGRVVEITPRTMTLDPCCRVLRQPAWATWEMGEFLPEWTLPYRHPRTVQLPVLEIGLWDGKVPTWAEAVGE